ncbi:unnamed protein product [Polarella glacialis]|uniref:Uncharacterized protein n=1 Tax=Polarella glacialis TaxID=89957 RepID=A0A813DJ82_POLGL|nr:unnamed protein product [Polarella glacialis]
MSSLPESESEAESAVLLRLLTAAQPVPRGEAPSGVRLERLPHVDELLVADRDFLPGQPVLRERFLLLGPSELPPLHMFRPVPQDVGTVEIVGAEVGFPGAVVFDNEHLKLLLEFLNSEEAVQADVLRMQDGMEPGSETFESTRRVAQWLIDQQLPWLEGPTQELEVLARLLRLFCVNSHPCKVAGNTSGLLKWGTMINHSSVPNVVYSSAKVELPLVDLISDGMAVKTTHLHLHNVACSQTACESHLICSSVCLESQMRAPTLQLGKPNSRVSSGAT